MNRWLGLDDLIALHQLQTRGVQLDLERATLWLHTPLQAALHAHVPFSAIGAETLVLYPTGTPRVQASGFLQMRPRAGRPEADVVYLAPALDADDDAVSTWYRLLAECAQTIGARGGQRLFAQIPAGNGCEEVFRQAGFSAYAHEDIYRLDTWLPNLSREKILRHQRARDGWNLLRLYTQLTPRPVQLAEGMLSPQGQGGKLGDWWDQSRGAGYILELEGELAGAVRMRRGRAAYWLRFGLHPQAQEHADILLYGALSLLWAAPHLPIYCGVRDYESGMTSALDVAGFARVQTRSLLVKSTTAHVKEPRLKLMPALEHHPKPAASITQPTK